MGQSTSPYTVLLGDGIIGDDGSVMNPTDEPVMVGTGSIVREIPPMSMAVLVRNVGTTFYCQPGSWPCCYADTEVLSCWCSDSVDTFKNCTPHPTCCVFNEFNFCCAEELAGPPAP